MCSHYQTLKDAELLLKKFGVREKPATIGHYDMRPRYQGVFVRRPPEQGSGDEAVPDRDALVGQWGMIPPGTRPEKLKEANKKSTFNARAETAHQLWTFRGAWAKGQHCVIPADAIFEPDWRPVVERTSARPVATRFIRADGAPLGITGLWDRYQDATGEWQVSYAMLTINADQDPLFKHYHQPGKEKRMVVILPEDAYADWLSAPAANSRDFLIPFPADRLLAEPQAK